jgi:hypothetical protein|tara:strand:+ start:42 stop:569 length:528 start_codon:yes stop_codon:yes gene_type:complete
MSVENLKKMSNADQLLKQFKRIKKKKDDEKAASERIPEDLKQDIKNRKGVKFKNKVGQLIFRGAAKTKKKEKDKIGKAMDVKMELIKTPEFKDKPKQAYKLATKLDKPVPGGIKPDLDRQKLKNLLSDPDRLFGSDRPTEKNMGGKIMKRRPVTMNMGGQVDGVEDLTTEMDITE